MEWNQREKKEDAQKCAAAFFQGHVYTSALLDPLVYSYLLFFYPLRPSIPIYIRPTRSYKVSSHYLMARHADRSRVRDYATREMFGAVHN